jgi:hypothetical protein
LHETGYEKPGSASEFFREVSVEESRRKFLQISSGLAAAAVASLTPASVVASPVADDTDVEVENAFGKLAAALKSGDLASFYGSMHTDFTMVDEDSPFRMNKEQFQDHIGFHVGGVWNRFEWLPLDTTARAFGSSGLVTGTATFRGKPADDGFRIRHLLFTQTWVREATGWQLLLWHQSSLDGHIIGVSPG